MNHEPHTLYLRGDDPLKLESELSPCGVWFAKDSAGQFEKTRKGEFIAYSQSYPHVALAKCESLGISATVAA